MVFDLGCFYITSNFAERLMARYVAR